MKLKHLLAEGWHIGPGATLDEVRRTEERLGVVFPADYVELITWSNGLDFRWGERYFRLWAVHRVPQRNSALDIQAAHPGAVAIGGDAGELLYLLDYSVAPTSPRLIEVDTDMLGLEFTVQGSSLTDALYAWSGLTSARQALLQCLAARLESAAMPG